MGIALLLIMFHWFADFVMQAERWALGKSKNWEDLLTHTAVYSGVMVIPALIGSWDILGSLVFGVITFVAHTATDYYTSRIVSKKFEDGHLGSDLPNFGAFTIIGLDQVLHYFQLIITYWLLF